MKIKNKHLVIIVAIVAIFIFLTTRNQNQPQSNVASQKQSAPVVNRGNCLADDCLMVSDLEYPAGTLPKEVKSALDRALDDEYKAFATYQAIISKFGSVRPFAMIIGAEEQHIASLKAVYDKYGETPAANPYLNKVSAPATLALSCAAGVQAEIDNADLYEKDLLTHVTDYPDITAVFNNLMSASRTKHLPAFERCSQ